jgi:hypothetical protein
MLSLPSPEKWRQNRFWRRTRKTVSACYLAMLQCSYWVNLRRPASRDIAGHQSYTSE